MAWTIEIAQLPLPIPLANGIASHAFWVLKNNGVVVAELQGLATARDGAIKPMGGPFNPFDTIGMYNVDAATLATADFGVFNGSFMSTWRGVTSSQVWSGSQADAMARWDLAVSIARVVNALNIDYGPLVVNGFNSNSVAEMAGDLLGFPGVRPPPKADGTDPWATGWNKNLATKVIDGILRSIEAREDALGRPLTSDELKPYLDLLERMQPAEDYCFPSGTAVLTVDGHASVDSLVPGDVVLAFDPSTDLGRGALVPKRVVRLFYNETEEWLRLTWREGGEERELTVTPGHRFLDAQGRFRRIDEIIEDAAPTVVLADGTLAQVRAERIVWSEATRHLFDEVEAVAMAAGDGLAHRRGGAWRSYNFEVEDLHTYVAGGVRVHNDSQATIDLAGNIGRTFGTLLANVLLEDESQFVTVLGGTVLGAVTENLAEIITDTGFHLFDGTQLNFANSASTALRQLNDLPAELLAGFSTSVQSLLVAELGEELGLEGFGAQLFSTVGTTYLGSVAEQVSDNLVHGLDAFNGVDWSVPWKAVGGSIGVFFGSSLAHDLLPAETLEGSIGGSLGSLVGSSLGYSYIGSTFGQSLGAFANFLLPGVGAFLGTLLGTFIGDLFGQEPDPGAEFWVFERDLGSVVPGAQYELVAFAIAQDGFPSDTTRGLLKAVQDLTVDYLKNIGANDIANANIADFSTPSVATNVAPYFFDANPLIRVLQRMSVEVAGDGSLRFYVNSRQVDSAEAMVDGAVTDFLRDSQPIGGDIFLKRAVVNSAGDSSFTIASAMATAAEFEHYQENREVINALIAGSEDTAFAGTWAYVLAGAEALGLAQTNQSDFNGGLGGFIASLIDAGIAVDFSQVLLSRGTGGEVFIEVAVEDAASIPTYVNLFSNGATITPDGNGATIRFSFDANLTGVGYNNLTTSTQIGTSARYGVNGESNGRDLWIAPDNNNYDFVDVGTHTINVGDAEIESSDDIIIMGGGADSIQAGTGWDWISGGAGNDTIFGGDQDDTIFGGAGSDLIYGGNQMDYLEGGAGADTICGFLPGQIPAETNFDDLGTASYATSNAAVQINLETGTASGGHATGDVISFISNLVGSNYNDLLVGETNTSNWLEGGAGADTLNGGGGPFDADRASYLNASSGVLASLAQPTINTGDAAGDIYISIEGLHGSQYDDTLIGDSSDNILNGDRGDDILVAGEGKDTIQGGFGFDVLSYRNLAYAIIIDLFDWTASSSAVADDTVVDLITTSSNGVEAYEATDYNDTMRGSTLDDVLIGRAGHDRIDGADGSDALIGENGDDTLTGAAGDDTIDGGNGEDSILGSSGDDLIHGGSNFDTIHGGDGNDTVWGDNGRDVVFLGAGNDVFNDDAQNDTNGRDSVDGGDGNDTLKGDGGSDTLFGANGDDSIRGGLGDDNLQGGANYDTLNGGVGDDTLSGGSGFDSLLGEDGQDLIIGGYGNDQIGGGYGDDTIWGDVGGSPSDGDSDTINASLGNDSVIAGGGADYVDGGDGSDTLHGQDGDDTIRGGLGADTVFLGVGSDVFHDVQEGGTQGSDTVDGGDGNDTIYGNAGFDHFSGGSGNDLIFGGYGEDNLGGGLGSDTIWGDVAVDPTLGDADTINGADGDDWVEAGGGDDVVYGGDGHDTLSGSHDNDSIVGELGLDDLRGGDGNDTIRGDLVGQSSFGDADTISGADGDDWVEAGGGADYVNGGEGVDTIYGQHGDDTIDGAGGDDDLQGGDGDDILFGGIGNDSLTSGAGADIIWAGAGDDWLNGGNGWDSLHGGTGNDEFYHSGTANFGTEWIEDFDEHAGDSDVLVFGDSSAAIEDFTFNLGYNNAHGHQVNDPNNVAHRELFVGDSRTGLTLWVLEDAELLDDVRIRIAGDATVYSLNVEDFL